MRGWTLDNQNKHNTILNLPESRQVGKIWLQKADYSKILLYGTLEWSCHWSALNWTSKIWLSDYHHHSNLPLRQRSQTQSAIVLFSNYVQILPLLMLLFDPLSWYWRLADEGSHGFCMAAGKPTLELFVELDWVCWWSFHWSTRQLLQSSSDFQR